MQILTSASNKKIASIIASITKGELKLNPAFQRKLVWNSNHKEQFIDTILKGYPFPEIYVADSEIDTTTCTATQIVVDGQQRLSAIIEYIHDDLKLKNINKYTELSEEQKRAFLNYDVVIRDLKDSSEEIIKEVFRRINQTSYSLKAIEINNAIYDGEFISTAKLILDEFTKANLPIFSETEISRMADLNFILLIMSTIEEQGYFTGNKETERYIKQLNENYVNAPVVTENLLRVLKLIVSFEFSSDSIWFGKSNFFTLVIELYKDNGVHTNIKDNLINFENKIIESRLAITDTSDYRKYYDSMYTGTNSRTSRIARGELFKKYILY